MRGDEDAETQGDSERSSREVEIPPVVGMTRGEDLCRRDGSPAERGDVTVTCDGRLQRLQDLSAGRNSILSPSSRLTTFDFELTADGREPYGAMSGLTGVG
jgi:hypothetical protein